MRRAPNDRQAYIERFVRVFRMIGSPGYPLDDERIRELAARPTTAATVRRAPAASWRRSWPPATGLAPARARVPTMVIHGPTTRWCPSAAGRHRRGHPRRRADRDPRHGARPPARGVAAGRRRGGGDRRAGGGPPAGLRSARRPVLRRQPPGQRQRLVVELVLDQLVALRTRRAGRRAPCPTRRAVSLATEPVARVPVQAERRVDRLQRPLDRGSSPATTSTTHVRVRPPTTRWPMPASFETPRALTL